MLSRTNTRRIPPAALLLSLLAAAAVAGCAGSRPAPDGSAHLLPFEPAAHPAAVEKLWSRRLGGLITDLAVSRDGSSVLVATAPDRDSVPGAPGYHLWAFDGSGKLRWKQPSKGPVRGLALAGEPPVALVATYDEEITALRPSGAEAWTQDAMCRPVPGAGRGEFVCYHDDDAESDIAFDVYRIDGSKRLSYPVVDDILALKTSQDGRNLAVALTRGQVLLFDPSFRSLWQRAVDGEIVDVAVSSGGSPRVIVLHDLEPRASGVARQRLSVFDASGARVAQADLALRAGQVEATPDGSAAVAYGNGEGGQRVWYYPLGGLGRAAAAGTGALRLGWMAGDSRAADYSSSVTAAGALVFAGFEDIGAASRHAHLVGFDASGKLAVDIPLHAEEGAYLYAYGLARDGAIVVTATDDGVVSAFRVGQ